MWIKFPRDDMMVYRLHGKPDSEVVTIENLPSGRMTTKISARIYEFLSGRMTLNIDGEEEIEVSSLDEAGTLVALFCES
jgi:hypothetical protein